MTESKWCESDFRWEITCGDGSVYRPRFYIGAIGGLHHPSYPNVDRERFQGKQFHSAEWNNSWRSKGQRVAVIGSAASAVQLVPEIAPDAEHVYVFQRTPNWIARRSVPMLVPTGKYSEWMKTAFANVPLLEKAHRLSIYLMQESLFTAGVFDTHGTAAKIATYALTKNMQQQCGGDMELAAKIIPDYSPGCKRICRVDNYIPALRRDNVDLITSGVSKVDEDSVYDSEGNKYQVDTIIYATGFHPGSLGSNTKLIGANGIQKEGDDISNSGFDSYLGIVTPDFPNSFLLLGPNTGLGHNSIILMIESQIEYALRIMNEAIDNDIDRLEIKPEFVRKFCEWVDEEFKKRVWLTGGCNSYYKNDDGKVFALYPGSTLHYFRSIASAPSLLQSYKIKSKI